MVSTRHVLIVTLTTALLTSWSPAADAGDSERQRAQMIYRLAKFVEWPSADGELTICNTERSGIQRHLRALHGKKVKGRKVVVRSVGKAHTQACDVLWLGSQYPRRVKPRAGMLTIGAGDAFLDAGGMISIEFDASRIVLNVNRTAIKAGDLDISSQVLRIAESVR